MPKVIVYIMLAFSLCYATFFALALAVAKMILPLFGAGIGNLLVLAGFAAAVQAAQWMVPRFVQGQPFYYPSNSIPPRICAAIFIALSASIVDGFFFGSTSFLITGEVMAPGLVRQFIMGLVYFFLSHVLLTNIPSAPKALSRKIANLLPAIEAFNRLSFTDQSVLLSAVETNQPDEVTVLTNKASDNDRFWEQLARFGWMERAEIPSKWVGTPLEGVGAPWNITAAGRRALPEFVRLAKSAQNRQIQDN